VALVALSQLLEAARPAGYAVGYFEAWDSHSLEAVALAAEAEGAPVVLGFGGMMMEQAWLDRFGIEPLGAYGRAVAERLSVPAALILNEVWEWDHACRGTQSGFNVVMLNTCEKPFEQNVEMTKRLVQVAHPKGVEVQAELGRLPNFGDDDPGETTDAAQAREFVARTGVDFLAVSVGNMHLGTEADTGVDCERLRAIRRQVDIPLVIHGGSGLAEQAVASLIHEGVALFHVGTIMKKRFRHALQATLARCDEPCDYQAVVGSRKPSDLLGPAKAAVTETVRRFMRLYGSSGKAA